MISLISSDKTCKVLLIDDSGVYRLSITEILKEINVKTILADNGLSGLKLAVSKKPELILLDVLMPGITGFEVCRKLKSNEATKNIPIIFLTGITDSDKEYLGFELGAVDYITKPINRDVLKARVLTQINLNRQQELLIATNLELEAFNYTLSHDLKNPIQVMKTYIPFIKEKFEALNDEEGLEDIMSIEEAQNKMVLIMEDMLQLAQISKIELMIEPVDLSKLTKNIAFGFKKRLNYENANIIISENMSIDADSKLFGVAISNIIQNALKYSSKVKGPEIEVNKIRINDIETIRIKDNGVGFDSTKATDIFEAFTRCHSSSDYEGTGIGLAIVKRIIEKHNGSIWNDSRVGEGATVFIQI